MSHAPRRLEIYDYIAGMSAELAKMADAADDKILEYLFRLAAEIAARQCDPCPDLEVQRELCEHQQKMPTQ